MAYFTVHFATIEGLENGNVLLLHWLNALHTYGLLNIGCKYATALFNCGLHLLHLVILVCASFFFTSILFVLESAVSFVIFLWQHAKSLRDPMFIATMQSYTLYFE